MHQDPADSFHVIRTIITMIRELLRRSVGRIVTAFLCIFLMSMTPTVLLILTLTTAPQSIVRAALVVISAAYIIPLSAMMSLNYATYRGIRQMVQDVGLGKRIGTELIAFLESTSRTRIPMIEFTARLKSYFKGAKQTAHTERPGLTGRLTPIATGAIFFVTRLAFNRIAKDCIVDGQLDLTTFTEQIAQRADNTLTNYFKKILWDFTRILLCGCLFFLCLSLWLTIQLINWFS